MFFNFMELDILDNSMLETKSNNIVKSFTNLNNNLTKQVVGQKQLVNSLIISLLAGGHVLIEGMPGLAKTTAAKALANSVSCTLKRIQFTPDLLPSDITGSEIYLPATGDFSFNKGPVFENFILADEINRASAKVQAALLECMEEKQVTVGKMSYKLPNIFMVLATQNPIEQAGTYPLPEAQLDRFFMQILVDYPSKEEELKILDLVNNTTNYQAESLLTETDILQAREQSQAIYLDSKLRQYIVSIVRATRSPADYSKELAPYIQYGSSTRGAIALEKAAKAYAWLQGSDYVSPQHIQSLVPSILRHRLLMSFAATADAVTADEVLQQLLKLVAVP